MMSSQILMIEFEQMIIFLAKTRFDRNFIKFLGNDHKEKFNLFQY